MADKIIHIPVGSGYLYHDVFTGKVPANSEIETEEHRLGYIEKGGEIDYKPTFKTFKDDFGIIQRNVLTAEEATFKASLIAWSAADFNTFVSTARITETQGHRTIKIGGMGHDDGKVHLFRFVHPDSQYGDVRLTIVGTQTGGFKLNFKPDDAGNMDLEITAQASDSEGTLIIYDEEVLGDTVKASGLTVSSVAGSTTGTTKLTVTPEIAKGNSYRYIMGAQILSVGAALTGWTAWDGTSDITAATGDILTVAEVDSKGAAVKAGICTVTAKA
ncbi:hypothetical protein FL966_01790 [Caproiciproducens galactitolivorans]|uniref:S-layer protein SbsC C-terminal domain-containing protein n=1 Tax=Caproiciproducens galactitolivorans TaxID=642589 RepID=A0A4Z0Y780_9FIRM|nr:hypothetical protein [Caproiciproducens galactitolivorans]QEY33875.1 hypothetical protein FL966_01790 [Caproiciproducens galactitolivorans]TGJ75385.1 hypothetical protein CAGA_24840 [Caproiciproducens galactitolivorans]